MIKNGYHGNEDVDLVRNRIKVGLMPLHTTTISSFCKKASQKLNALLRIVSCMTFDQRRLILNSFITLYFSYCPIVWMFHNRKLNEGINYIHKRDLRIVSKDFNSSFQELFIEGSSLNIHHINLQKPVTGIFKVKKMLITWAHEWCFWVYRKNIFSTNNFTSQVKEDPCIKIWHRNIFLPWLQITEPNEYKTIESLTDFKEKIKTGVLENYTPCRLCKTYMQEQVGFV